MHIRLKIISSGFSKSHLFYFNVQKTFGCEKFNINFDNFACKSSWFIHSNCNTVRFGIDVQKGFATIVHVEYVKISLYRYWESISVLSYHCIIVRNYYDEFYISTWGNGDRKFSISPNREFITLGVSWSVRNYMENSWKYDEKPLHPLCRRCMQHLFL